MDRLQPEVAAAPDRLVLLRVMLRISPVSHDNAVCRWLKRGDNGSWVSAIWNASILAS